MFYSYIVLLLVSLSQALPVTTTAKEESVNPDPIFDLVPEGVDPAVFFASLDGSFFNLENDGVTTASLKKREKIPNEKKNERDSSTMASQPKPAFEVQSGEVLDDYDFTKGQPGVAPRMTGSVQIDKAQDEQPQDFEYYNFGEGSASSNPAATFLEGADFEKIATPKCRLLNCTGPIPNDGTWQVELPKSEGEICHQTVVPMNGCINNKGYPVGMVCTFCCECSSEFVTEMKKTVGYQKDYKP